MTISLKSKAATAVDAVENVHPVQKVKSFRKLVPSPVARRVARASLHVQHKSPEILFVTGIGLGVVTVVTACRATLQLEGVLEDLQADIDNIRDLEEMDKLPAGTDADKLTRYLRVKGAGKVAKLYAPSLGLGVMAVASLTGSHHIMTRRNVALTAAYAAVEKSFDEYRERVRNELGEDRDRELMFGTEERTIVEDDGNGKITKKVVKTFADGRSPYARIWDATSSSEWQNNAFTNRNFILTQQRWANDLLQHQGHLFLNDVYKLLGLSPTSAGQAVGWVVGHKDSVIDFGILDRQNTDEKVHEFMFGNEKSILLDFNVDGPVWQLLDELNN